jgi:hypothetical protein
VREFVFVLYYDFVAEFGFMSCSCTGFYLYLLLEQFLHWPAGDILR